MNSRVKPDVKAIYLNTQTNLLSERSLTKFD